MDGRGLGADGPVAGRRRGLVTVPTLAPGPAGGGVEPHLAADQRHPHLRSEINSRGKPVGFHSRPGGRDPQGARLVRVADRPNRAGVYNAEVEIRSGSDWLPKRSTLYPDRLDRNAVIQAVLHAFAGRTTGGAEKFRGPSGQGFTIEGYYQNGRINTAYPIFARGE